MRIRLIVPLLLALSGCGETDDDNTSSTSTSSSSSSSSSGHTSNLEQWHYILGINVGGEFYLDKSGLPFEADQYFNGATSQVISDSITGTQQQPLYQSERWGDISYDIPVDAGQYKVVLKFVEMYWSASGSRLINVSIENKNHTSGLDIYSKVGKFSAYDITAQNVVVNDGKLSIRVTASADNGTLSAIEIYADKDNAATFSDASIADGEGIYLQSCSGCHGSKGDGNGFFPSLIKSECTLCASPPALISTISLTMPSNGDVCTGECARNVAGFILTNFNDSVVSNEECRVKTSPIRRLTRFEYSNTVYDLLADNTRPGNVLPSEEIGNGFGNDANSMSVSSFLAEQFGRVAEDIAQRVIDNSSQWSQLHTCVNNVNSSNANSCGDQLIDKLLPRAFRRQVTSTERQAFINLQRSLYSSNSNNFKKSIQGVIEAVLQSPEFLYRAELGALSNGRLRPTNYEMASRLSYFFWGSMPDDTLLELAAQGRLTNNTEIRAQAERLLNHEKARPMIRYFFDAYLPISHLTQLERDSVEFPTFNALIGSLMREETQTFLEHIIFDGPGDWQSALTAPYSFMNQTLAQFYGISGVFGDNFRQVQTDSNQRLGLLTQAGIMAGTTHSGHTNPVTRGGYVMKKLLCVNIPLPSGDLAELITPPDPSSGLTARERFTEHSKNAVCRQCHNLMDPVGLVFENYDPVGLFRTYENGVLIDTSGELPGAHIPVGNAIELVSAIADDPRTHQCFAYNWANFAYGKTIGSSESCVKDTITTMFDKSGHDIKTLLIDLTQTEAFLFLRADHLQ